MKVALFNKLEGIVHPKMFTLIMSVQTCLTTFLLWNTRYSDKCLSVLCFCVNTVLCWTPLTCIM